MRASGKVYWITGYSGAGKTTIGRKLHQSLLSSSVNCIYLDGDELREVFGLTDKYDMETRLQLAFSYAKLCKLLSQQGVDIICATVSMFNVVREWNANNIPNYVEIFIRVRKETLIMRDQKYLYSDLNEGLNQDVVGFDLVAEEPSKPNLIFDNDGLLTPDFIVEEILNYCKEDSILI